MTDRLTHLVQGFLSGRRGRKRKEALTAYLFLLPALLIIFTFGLWPVFHAFYVSLHKWNIKPQGSTCIPYWLARIGLGNAQTLKQTDCRGLDNYVGLLGLQDPSAVLKMILALATWAVAYRLWRSRVTVTEAQERTRTVGAIVMALVGAGLLAWALPGLLASGEWTYLISIGLVVMAWPVWKGAHLAHSTTRLVLRLLAACMLLSGAVFFFFVDFSRMWTLGNAKFFYSLIRTLFYSLGTVPVQLTVSLVLAYLLFQNIKGRGLFRLIYFLPYIAPTVATSVVFKRIFSLRETGLMNQIIGLFGLPPMRWLNEPKAIMPLLVETLNGIFKTKLAWPQFEEPLGAFLNGPSLALVSVMIYNWWVYIGYDTVIYLAGLGNIPHELYEAAAIDGADRRTSFFNITIPLLSPTIFFLAIMATIGAFKAFNSLWVMYESNSLDTVDTTSILIFRTFRSNGQFGEAAAMSFILFAVIYALSKVQQRIEDKLVFYG